MQKKGIMPRLKMMMKKTAAFYLFSLLTIGLLLLPACGKKGGSTPPPTIISNGSWTWMGGNDVPNIAGNYGTLGVAAPTNLPGPREFPAFAFGTSPTDPTGTFWLFGGSGLASDGTPGYLNDLWKFDGTNWTWVAGSTAINTPTNYGTQGVTAPTNDPGARESAASWTDASGNFWLFGGLEVTNKVKGELNDLWKFDGTHWTWISGTNIINAEGSFDAAGNILPGAVPNARYGAASWTDKNGIFWLFGGFGTSSGVGVHLNDLWKFDPTTAVWTWVSGGPTSAGGGYGPAPGTPTPGNIPGARREAAGWADASGNQWIFGGFGLASSGTGYLNDLWKFDGTAWTWMAGGNVVNGGGVFGAPPAPAPGNTPSARGAAAGWTDASGNFWLFGGTGFGTGGVGLLNDLWKFDGTNWAWISGTNGTYMTDLYGTLGVAAPGNAPGGRSGAGAWADPSGRLWLFGGFGLGNGLNNDLWRYQPP